MLQTDTAKTKATVVAWAYNENDLRLTARSFCARHNHRCAFQADRAPPTVFPDDWTAWPEDQRALYEIRYRRLIFHNEKGFQVDMEYKNIMKYS